MTNLLGKTALVTGASRGLGKGIALALGRNGADVVVTDIFLQQELNNETQVRPGSMDELALKEHLIFSDDIAQEIRGLKRKCIVARMDVTDKNGINEVMRKVKKTLGKGIDILVNNAGTIDHKATIENQEEDLWDRDLKVNLTGPFNCIRAVWDGMKKENWGRIINISSMAGLLGGFGQASYAATKMGLVGLTKTIALEGARFGITCNAVAPGPIATEAFLLKEKLGINPEINKRIINKTAMKKAGEVQDIANAVCFLASDQAKYITGEVIPVCGGLDLFVF